MKYMLLIYIDQQIWERVTEDERQQMLNESVKLAHEINSSGHYLASARLQPTSTATTVRIREGKRLMTDGPFAETREQMGGYYLIDAKDLEEAMSIAERIPGGRVGAVEIRPVMEVQGLPSK
ncbi:MAG: YciI family protein [Blastocatellia bacterium]|nr:YciI family protein [Blastocatellia bacterium]